MAIPQVIQELASKIRSAVYGREVRESIAQSIEVTGNTADNAKKLSDNIQAQVNVLTVEGDSSVEAAQARVDAVGISYATLKDRLDSEQIVVSEYEPLSADMWYEEKNDQSI
ncbi:hypothetical protein [Bacillus sp. CH30_1T]|uniref:hypothetical protein n=1 Tax=Bacillus sp. CH30_1T TaxID=2604836 RepID=UPI0021CD7A74|nr:hypothetical protein [Bacillus sp. CH30_1T]